MVSRPGPAECRRSSAQRDPEGSGRHARASRHTRLGMSSLDRRRRGGRVAMQGQSKYADGFMDETDREVSSLTDRAFRSLCVGEEAVYADPELASSPRDAFPVDLPATFQHSFMDSQDQGLRYASRQSNGAIEATWQHRRSRSRVSSLIKAFSSSEGGSAPDGVPDGRRSNPDGWTWERSALLSLNNELSDFPAYCQDPFTPSASLQASHLGPVSAASMTLTNKASKATFRKLSSINYFLHSEHSPFQTWADYNRIPCEREATPPSLSPSAFHRWYDSPLYKELTASHRIQTTRSEDAKSYWTPSKDRTPSEPLRSAAQPKASAVEKRCESEVVAKCPPWRKSRNLSNSQLPVYRPCTASPCSHASRRRDEALLPGSRPSAVHQVRTLPDEQAAGICTPFSISQLLTPVLNARQEMETSEVSQYELSPADDLAAIRDAEPCPPPELKLRDSYKAMASSLLFNLKDNRKRVKSTYSPAKFKSQELSDSDNLPSRQDNAALTSKKSPSGPPGPGISTYMQPGAAEACSVYSPALQPAKASAVDHTKYTEANRLDDYFTLISPPTVKEASHYSDSDRIAQERAQQRDQLLGSQQSQSRYSQHLPSTSNEILSRNKLSQPTWKEYKTSPTEQSSTGGPSGSATVKYSDNERRNSFSAKEKDVMRRDELPHNKIDATQSLASFKKHDAGQEAQGDRSSHNTDALNLSESITVRSARSSLKAEEPVLNTPSSQTLQAQKWGGTTKGIHSLQEKLGADTGSDTNTERQNPRQCLLPQKVTEHNRIAVTEIKENGRVQPEVLKIQANGPDRHNVPASCQNLQDLSIGAVSKANDQTAEIPAKLSSNGVICTVQNDDPATKHIQSLKENKHILSDVLPKPEEPTETTASLQNEELPDQGQTSVRYLSNRESTSDNYSNYIQAKPRVGQLATGLKLHESKTPAATEQDHMKNAHPIEEYYWAKQGEQTTNEETLNRGHPIAGRTRAGEMLAQNSIKAGTEFELGISKDQGSDGPEADGREKRQGFAGNAVSINDSFVQERKKSHQELHMATEQGAEGNLSERRARDGKLTKCKGPGDADGEVATHPVGRGQAISEGDDPAKHMGAAKGNKHNGLASQEHPKVKHRIFTFNQRDHAMQELLTSKVKAHAQKEITAIKEKGHAKREAGAASREDSRERVKGGRAAPPSFSHANQAAAIASENWDFKVETPPREPDTLAKMRKENEAPQTGEKQETPASHGSQESKRTALLTKKEGAGNDALNGHKNTINDRRDLLQIGSKSHTQNSSNVIGETYSPKRDIKQKHDTCRAEEKQGSANKEIHENRVSSKQELLSADSGKAETAPVNSQAEVTLAGKQQNISKKVLSYGEKGHALNKDASLGEIPKTTLEFPARTMEESGVPHNDRLKNNIQPKQEALQSKNKEHIQNDSTKTDKYYPSDRGKLPAEKENRARVCTFPSTGSAIEKPLKDLLKGKESVKEGDRMEGPKGEYSTLEAASMQKVQDGKEDKSTGTPMGNVQDIKEDKSIGTPIADVRDKKDDKTTGTPMRNVQDKKEDKNTGTPMRNVQDKKEDKNTGTPMRNVQDKKEEKNTGTPMRNVQDRKEDKNTGTPMRNVQDRKEEKNTGTPMRNVHDKKEDKNTGTPMRNVQDKKEDKNTGTPMRNVQSRKEVLGTIENEFVRIDVFAITRKADAEWEDSSSEHNDDSVMCEMKERELIKEEAVTYTAGSSNASTISSHTVKTAGEGKEIPTKQNCPTSEAITVEELSKPDKERPVERDIQGGKATKEMTNPLVIVTKEQSKTVPSVEHEHIFPVTQSRKGITNECEPVSKSHHKEVLTTREHKKSANKSGGPAMPCTILPTAAEQHTQLETLGKEDSPARKHFQPKVPTTEGGLEDSVYAKSRHDKQMVYREQPTEPEILRTTKSSKPFKLPATENTKCGTDRIKLNTSPEVPAKKEAPEINISYTCNDVSELHTFTKEHTKVIMSAPEDHKSDGHAQAHTFSAEEHKKEASGRKSTKSDVYEKKERAKSGNQVPITMFDSKGAVPTNLQEHTKPGLHVATEIIQPGLCVKPEDSKPSKLATTEHPKPHAHTAKDIPVFTEHITSVAHILREHSKHVKPEDSKPVKMEHPKPGVCVKPDNIKPGIPVANEYPKPGIHLKSEHSKPGVPITTEYSKTDLPKTTEHPKPDVAVTVQHPKPVLCVKSEHSITGIPVTTEFPKPDVPRTIEHQKPDMHVKPEDNKPGIPRTTEHQKPGLYVKPGDSKAIVSVTGEYPIPKRMDHPKQDGPVTKEQTKPKPGVPFRTEHPKLDIPVAREHTKPGLHVKSGHSKPDISGTSEYRKPDVPETTEYLKPDVPVTTDHPKPGMPFKIEHPKPGVLLATGHSKAGAPMTTEHSKQGILLKSEHNKPDISIAAEYPKAGIHLTAEHLKPGLPVTTEHSKLDAPVTTEHPKPGGPIIAEHPKPDVAVAIEHLKPVLRVKSEDRKTGIPVTTDYSKPGIHLTTEQTKPCVPITTEVYKPDMHVTPEDSKPSLPVAAKHPKPGVPVTTEHPKPAVPVTIEHLKPGLLVKSDHSKTGVPVTKGHPKPGIPVTTEHPKPDVPVTMEHPEQVLCVKSEASNPSAPFTAEHFKPSVCETTEYPKAVTIEHPELGLGVKSEHIETRIPVTNEHPKLDEPVTKDYPKTGAPVTMEHLKPALRVKSEVSKPSVPIATEHFKSVVPITREHPKAGVSVKPEDSKPRVAVTAGHPKPVVCVKQEYNKPHEPVKTEHPKPGISVLTEHTTPTLEYTKPEGALINEHPKAPLRKECIKPNVHVQKGHHELEPLCMESGNLEMLVKPKGFMSERVLINNRAIEPAKSEVHVKNDSTEVKPKDFLHPSNSHLEMKKYPPLVPEEKDQLSKHVFPSKEQKAKMGVLTDKEDLNKVRDVHTWMERDQVIAMKELEAKEDFSGRQANSRKRNSVSSIQPVYVETPVKPLNESYLSVQGAQQTLEQEFKVQNSLGNTEVMQQKENTEEVEGLQYYAISSHDTEVEPKGALFNPSPRTEMVLRTREMQHSGHEVDDGRWTSNTTDSAHVHLTSPQPDTSSPSLGKPTLFKVKDNTFKTSPVTKTVKPYFHKTFPEDIQLSSPISSEKGEDWYDGVSEEAKVAKHSVGLSNRFQQSREHATHSALPPSESTATRETHGYFRKNPALEEDECCSIGSALSEESYAAGTTDVANDRAGILGVTEGGGVLRGISDRLEPTCSGNEGKTFGKPPVVPPKTEKALRRAQKLTTRRIKKAESKVRPEGKWHLDQSSLRTVSSEPSSPTGLLLSQHPDGAPRYCMDPAYVPSAPKLVAQPFPLTERKLLQDPNSGQYFMVEMPVPVKTKTFFDPETGKYIQLSVRQSPEGTLSPASSLELLSPPYVLYPGFLTLPVPSVPPLRSSSQMSAPAALAEDQDRLELSEPWAQKGYCPEFGDSQLYLEPVYKQQDQPLEPLHSEGKSSASQRKLNIISMGELEDFAMESI